MNIKEKFDKILLNRGGDSLVDTFTLDIIKIIIPVLTSLVVCYITLYFTHKRNKETLNLQQKNHMESMKISEKKYQEQLIINEENERLKYLPYLSIVPKYKSNRFEGEMDKIDNLNIKSIPFELINEGVGIAFSIHLEYLDDNEKPKNMFNIAVAFKDNYKNGYNILGVRAPIDTDVLRVQSQTEFCLYLTAIDEKSNQVDPTTDINWKFNIVFYDIQGRQYKQSYSFYTSTGSNKIVRINSYMPQLIK
ncbi:hypothetical protein [Enterococcus faecalis]|uniref:hypothetical protein n=1 Tax=Enterococcus faecalis TaxID=1351 RepID=UPI00032D7626|nr:hypothetical protein [Enterococcus faecalis]EOJ71566.1 hypothetical protein WMY_01939 [Enterococcus faecalis EnGen0337]MDL4974210.1 hypothetical protein [Enterococcus faecalis]